MGDDWLFRHFIKLVSYGVQDEISNNFIIYRSFIVFNIHKKYTQQPLKKHNLIFIVSVQWVVNLGSPHGLLNIDTTKNYLKISLSSGALVDDHMTIEQR